METRFQPNLSLIDQGFITGHVCFATWSEHGEAGGAGAIFDLAGNDENRR